MTKSRIGLVNLSFEPGDIFVALERYRGMMQTCSKQKGIDISYEFQDDHIHFYKNTIWNFDKAYIKCTDQFGENCHLTMLNLPVYKYGLSLPLLRSLIVLSTVLGFQCISLVLLVF